jgi:hypothetical protein
MHTLQYSIAYSPCFCFSHWEPVRFKLSLMDSGVLSALDWWSFFQLLMSCHVSRSIFRRFN